MTTCEQGQSFHSGQGVQITVGCAEAELGAELLPAARYIKAHLIWGCVCAIKKSINCSFSDTILEREAFKGFLSDTRLLGIWKTASSCSERVQRHFHGAAARLWLANAIRDYLAASLSSCVLEWVNLWLKRRLNFIFSFRLFWLAAVRHCKKLRGDTADAALDLWTLIRGAVNQRRMLQGGLLLKSTWSNPLGDAAPRKSGLAKIMRWRRSAVASLVIRRSHLLNEKKKKKKAGGGPPEMMNWSG